MKRVSKGLCSKKLALFTSILLANSAAQAVKLDVGGSDWDVNLDNSIQYTLGFRAKDIDDNIGNHPAFAQGDYKFPDKGDVVTNRIQDLIELQAVYKGTMGIRLSGSVWKDFAYDDVSEHNPALRPLIGDIYPSGRYSDHTSKFYEQGAEWLDYFVFANFELGETPVHLKLGRFTQYWGNAFFFGFTNIGYSQSPVDFQKGFSQPGTEVKELFMPRQQVSVAVDISPELSIAAQYFFEYRANRYPEGGTFLGFFDPLYNGPEQWAGMINDGEIKPDDNNGNYGVKISWAPEWADADLGFYYRQFDEVDGWPTLLSPQGHLQLKYAEKTKLVGFSMEKSFGLTSVGFEYSYRMDTALNSAPLVLSEEGARGNTSNIILNSFVQLGKTKFWDTGVWLSEITYSRLHSVTMNENLYNGVGTANCVKNAGALGEGPGSGSWRDGCSTRSTFAFATLFEPQWLQVFPSIDLSMPISITAGLNGNGAYRAGGFYAKGSHITSVGLKATYKNATTLAVQYNNYHWRQGDTSIGPAGQQLAGFGGNGAVSLNDRPWLQLTLKTSF